MKLFSACLLACGALLAQTRVEGTVVSSPAGTPIAGVTVELRQNGVASYETTSDSQGEFRIDGVKPGVYTPEFKKPGFREPEREAPVRRPVSVAAGSPSIHLDAALMVPLATVSGAVLGTDRHPVAGAAVQLFTVGNFVGQTGLTDLKGQYFFRNVDPGAYILSAIVPKGTPPPATADGRRLAWVRTYYPAAPYPSDALKFPVAPGAELFGQDIQLQALPARALRGRVLSENGEPAAGVPVLAAPSNEIFAKDVEIQARTAADGNFEFPDLHDGDWRLTVQTEHAKAAAAQAITGADIDRLDLRLTAPFSLVGKVIYESSTEPLSDGGILLTPLEGGSNVPTSPWHSDGAFQIDNVAAGTYKIRPLSGPAHGYLASIKLGDREVIGQFVEIRSGSQAITITYRSDGGGISGSVEDCGKAVIVLAPRDSHLQTAEFLRQTICRTPDHFELSNVRPGDYYAWAFDKPPGMLETSAFSDQALLTQAVSVSVSPGQSTSVTLKVTHRD